MNLNAADYLLWVTGEILLVLACGVILKRRLVHEFPVFFAYTVFHVLRTVVLFTVQQRLSYADYFYAYWSTHVVSIALGFTVIHEIYCKVFQSYDAIQQLGGIVFGCVAAVLLVVSVLAAVSAPGIDTPGVVKAIVLLERSVRVMQCGLLMFLFLLSFYFGLSWRNHIFGIALGFGVFATIELVAIAVRAQIGAIANTAYSQVNSAAYSCGVLIWVCYLLAPKPAPQYMSMIHHDELEKWNQALLQLLER